MSILDYKRLRMENNYYWESGSRSASQIPFLCYTKVYWRVHWALPWSSWVHTHTLLLQYVFCCSCRRGDTTSLNCGHQRVYFLSTRWYMSVVSQRGMILAGDSLIIRRKTYSIATLCTIPTHPGANTDLRDERPATNHLSHGTAVRRVFNIIASSEHRSSDRYFLFRFPV
jgi:hypothetical protein